MTKTRLDNFLRELAETSVLEEIHGLVVSLRDAFEIDHAVYHWVSADGEQYGFGTYDPAWAKRYVDKDYLRVDPVVSGCFQRFHPVNWKTLDWSSKAARNFRQESVSYGVGNQGFSVPIRGPNGQFAMFSLSHNCSDDAWAEFTGKNQRDIILIAHYLNQKALEIEKSRAPDPVRPLSPREVDTLTYLAMGYGRGQVAEMLSISEHTLRAYIESARFKLGALNTTHAVAKALSEGFIVVGGAARAAEGKWPGKEEKNEISAAN
jgi:DNA-binding CsgD family transcriptional regulator